MSKISFSSDQVLLQGTKDLIKSGSSTPRLDCELLLAKTLDCSRIDLYKASHSLVTAEDRKTFDALLQRRKKNEPIAYLLGVKEFMGLEFKVSPQVLVPRPDTEFLVEEVSRYLQENSKTSLRILDIGAGSACITISLARRFVSNKYFSWDISKGALAVARENACKLLTDEHASIFFEQLDALDQSSWFRGERYHVIVSNPPYIGLQESPSLARDLQYEPSGALFAQNEGLQFYYMYSQYAKQVLFDRGRIFVEVSPHLANKVHKIFFDCGWQDVCITKDYSQNLRVVSCVKPADR